MKKYNNLMEQLENKGFDKENSTVGKNIAEEMLEHVNGGISDIDRGWRLTLWRLRF